MEPISIATAIGTLIFTKSIEKVGEKLGEKALDKSGQLMQYLKLKSPETANAIELSVQNPELIEQQPEKYSVEALVKRIEEAAKTDKELAAAIQALADATNSPQSTIQNFTKVADKIATYIVGDNARVDIGTLNM